MYSPEKLARIARLTERAEFVDYDALAEIMGTTPTSVKTSLSRRRLSLKKMRGGKAPEHPVPEWYDQILKHPYIRRHAARRDMTTRRLVEALIEAVILGNLVKAVLED